MRYVLLEVLNILNNIYTDMNIYIVEYRPVAKRWLRKKTAIAMQRVNKQTPVSMQRSRYCWTITMETVISMWSVPRCYKQDSLKQRVSCWSCQQFSWVKWHEVAGWWVREFSCQFSWKSACEEKTRRLVWNGRQPGTQLVELSVDKGSARLAVKKRTWEQEAEGSPSVEAITRKQLVETVIDWGH
jgi:hypothetical protein